MKEPKLDYPDDVNDDDELEDDENGEEEYAEGD